jgi:hypothetical protein
LMDEANIRLQKAIFAKLKEFGWLDDWRRIEKIWIY